jgi:hypothetical protein
MASLIERGFIAMLARNGRSLKNLRTGATIRGTVNRPGEVDISGELGSDPRMESVVEVEKCQNYSINCGDQLVDLESNEKWCVSSIKFNCPPYASRFGMVQLIK